MCNHSILPLTKLGRSRTNSSSKRWKLIRCYDWTWSSLHSWNRYCLLYSPLNAQVFFFSIGYIMQNALTSKDSYQIPGIDQCVESLTKQGYFWRWTQIKIIGKSESRARKRTRQHLVPSRPVQIASSNIQAEEHIEHVKQPMKIICSTVKWQLALVYQDYLVIFSRSVAEHLIQIQRVPGLLLADDDIEIVLFLRVRLWLSEPCHESTATHSIDKGT